MSSGNYRGLSLSMNHHLQKLARHSKSRRFIVVPTAFLAAISAYGQSIPLPGSQQSPTFTSAPLPGSESGDANPAARAVPAVAPPVKLPPQSALLQVQSAYQKLPLSVDDAKERLADLKARLAVARPKEIQEPIFHMCEWLADMADAHWRLCLALSKNEATRAASASERNLAIKFSSLKHEAWLLKAELFIRQQRLPEALGPLVDIVVAEPKSPTGIAAYEKLKEIGFSEEA
ncbi:MAG TPA: hypothetical protein V6D17_10295, partial [Candidatus Obscuribacterales bacterium]